LMRQIDIEEVDLMKVGTGVVAIFLVVALIWSLVVSIYKGAFIRAAIVTYAGHDATTTESMTIGGKKSLTVFCFDLVLGFINLLAGGLLVVLPTILSNNDLRIVIPLAVVLLIFEVLLNSAMIAGIPAVVVEGKSAFAAFSRSWSLCKSSACFIFSTSLCFVVLEILISLALEFGGLKIDGYAFIAYSVFKGIVTTAMISLSSIMMVVLYMSCRIRLEGCTQKQLVKDLKLSPMATPLVPMTGQKEDKKIDAQIV